MYNAECGNEHISKTFLFTGKQNRHGSQYSILLSRFNPPTLKIFLHRYFRSIPCRILGPFGLP